MLQGQPFCRSLRPLRLKAIVTTEHPGAVSYCGTYSPAQRGRAHLAMVMVHLALKTERPTLYGRRTSVRVDGSANYHGLPFTMVNITPLLSLPKGNHFVFWCEAIPALVTAHVSVVKKISEDDFLRSIDDYVPYVHKREDTKALLKGHFDEGDQVIVQGLQVSLVCPLARSKMLVPCRGVRCQHVQSFDACAYLDVNETTLRPSWSCPVCNNQVFVQDMRVDMFMLDVLRNADDECVAVVLQADGGVGPVMSDADHSVIIISDSPVKANDTHCDLPEVSGIDLTENSDGFCSPPGVRKLPLAFGSLNWFRLLRRWNQLPRRRERVIGSEPPAPATEHCSSLVSIVESFSGVHRPM